MSNYLLHNLGYDNPINFRYIVLDILKRYGICQHLRDYSISRLSLTDVNDWLILTDYEECNIKRAKERLKENQTILKQIESGDESYIQKEYEKQLSNAQSLRNSKHSWNIDEARRINKCAEEYYKYLAQWKMPSGGELGKNIQNELWDIYYTAIHDRDEHLEEDKKSVERMRETKDPIYEDIRAKVIDEVKSNILWQKDIIKSAKDCIKRIEKSNEIIKDIFYELDLVDKRVGDENGKID